MRNIAQKEALFSPVTIPRLQSNNMFNGRKSTLQKKKNKPTDWGGKEGEEGECEKSSWNRTEQTDIHSGVVSKTVSRWHAFPLTTGTWDTSKPALILKKLSTY